MQRIAFGIPLVLVALTGCASTDTAKVEPACVVRGRPLPAPPCSTLHQEKQDEPRDAHADKLTHAPNESDWMPPCGIQKNQWKVIVVHHSGSPKSTPKSMDEWHHERGWENGLGYDFVIGNGIGYEDGAIFVGNRWKKQIAGAHCASSAGKYFGVWRPDKFFNEHGIGICLVGDLESSRPTKKQLESLKKLSQFLTQKCGINPTYIYGHGEITHKTECPGDRLDMASIRRMVSQVSASSK